MAHEYTWKCGIQLTSRTTMRTNKPLSVNAIIADLLDGSRFVVRSIYRAKPSDREWSNMPEIVVHVWPLTRLTENELAKLRDRARYEPSDFAYPLEDIVFLPTAA